MPVIRKRPYKAGKNQPAVMTSVIRYGHGDELPLNIMEANLLYWATALMELTYGFIDRAIGKSAADPPVNIPRLRFVNAGLAVVVQTKPFSYLLEEVIEGKFVKYVTNGSATPTFAPEEEEFELATFLCCTQHIQYMKTGQTAFISDYQGMFYLYLFYSMYAL